MPFESLQKWFTRKPIPRHDLHFIIYTRHACPLCDEAARVVAKYQVRHEFSLETQDVDQSPELAKEFGLCIPVIAINGKVRFRGHVNEVLLQRILDARG
jgi:glutaredoxin